MLNVIFSFCTLHCNVITFPLWTVKAISGLFVRRKMLKFWKYSFSILSVKAMKSLNCLLFSLNICDDPFTVQKKKQLGRVLIFLSPLSERRCVLVDLFLRTIHGQTFINTDTLVYSCFNYQLNAQFLYFITIYTLHYNSRHVSSSTMLIFRRSNCIVTASGIVTLCKRLYSTPVESRICLLSTGVLYGCLQRVTIPDAVIIQFDLLKMSIVLLEKCRGL